MTPIARVRAGAFVLLAVTLACRAGVDPKSFLWIPPEATILWPATSNQRGIANVAFTIPLSDLGQRDAFTARLSQRLEEAGWRRRSREYLNPTVATSFEEGWKRAGGGLLPPAGAPKRKPGSYRWTGQWDDAEGKNVIHYRLFAYYLPEGLGAQIRISAEYVPLKLVMDSPNGRYIQ